MKEKVVKYIKNCFWLSSEDGKNKKEIYAFNTMRFIAFFFIFVHHAHSLFKTPGLEQAALGVSFFFIISGFLTGYLKRDIGNLNIKTIASYAKKKMSKIYPLFLFMVLVTMPRAGLFNIKNWDGFFNFLGKLAPCVTLTSSWIGNSKYYFAFFGGIWYLSTFFFLIVITPILMKIINKIRKSKHGVAKLLVTVCVLYGLSMVWAWATKKDSYLNYIFPPARMIEYVIGIIFGNLMATCGTFTKAKKAKKTARERTWYSILEVISIVIVTVVAIIVKTQGNQNLPVFLSQHNNVFLLPLIFVVCVFVRQKGILSLLLSNKPMVLLGRASMYLYLIHQPILYVMDKKYPHSMLYGYFLLLLTIIISVYLYKRSKRNENSSSGIQKSNN